ncbi:Uncharacterised protein [Dorea longicatena]|nr:Uncharacterised protein [Dorea longicatena]
MPYNFKWLPFTESLSIDMGILLDPISVMMLVVISTARTGSSNEYLPDVSVLGVGGRVLLSADWFLLYEAGGYCRFEEGVYRDPFC